MTEIQNRIIKLKKERGALILAHYYQPLEIQDVSDHVGDSFALAKLARESEASSLILCGVRFMAESAKILSPEKDVFLPAGDAGCPMADKITPEDVLSLRAEHPDAAVVCYVNSSAAVKAVSDICCTSSSAEKIVAALPEKKIIFIPDKNLGAYVAGKLPEKEFVFFDGCCPIHDRALGSDAVSVKECFPDAELLVHPECPEAVVGCADFVGSTAGILERARKSGAKSLVIGTETGICDILRREMPDRHIIPLRDDLVCPDMKKIRLEDILDCLEGKRKPVELPPEELLGAAKSLNAMIRLGE